MQIVLRVTAAIPGDNTCGHLAADCSEDLLNALVGIFTDMAGFGRVLGNGLHRVSAAGGAPSPALEQGRWPSFLPDGRHFFFSQLATIQLGSLDSKESKVLVETNSQGVYAEGQILYLR